MKKLGKSRDLGHLAVKLYDELAEWCEILRWPAVSGNRDILFAPRCLPLETGWKRKACVCSRRNLP